MCGKFYHSARGVWQMSDKQQLRFLNRQETKNVQSCKYTSTETRRGKGARGEGSEGQRDVSAHTVAWVCTWPGRCCKLASVSQDFLSFWGEHNTSELSDTETSLSLTCFTASTLECTVKKQASTWQSRQKGPCGRRRPVWLPELRSCVVPSWWPHLISLSVSAQVFQTLIKLLWHKYLSCLDPTTL